MEEKLPLGVEDFATVRRTCYYVDKTLLIDRLLQFPKGTAILVTRPRRFGKSLALSTVHSFFDINAKDKALFEGTKIWDTPAKEMAYSFPVVHLNLKDCFAKNKEDLFFYLRQALSTAYQQHDYLKNSEVLDSEEREEFRSFLQGEEIPESELSLALNKLIHWLAKHWKKGPILLIDEYDRPIESAFSGEYYDDVIDFFRHFYGIVLKGQVEYTFALLTGVLQIAKESLFSGLNNLVIDSAVSGIFDEYFGFTDKEVREILKNYGREDKFPEVEEWYGGYHIGEQNITNPWSLFSYILQNWKPCPYWVNTGENSLLETFSVAADLPAQWIESVFAGDYVLDEIDLSVNYRDIRNDERTFTAYLVSTGYLTIAENLGWNQVRLKIPNKEIGFLFQKEILNRFVKKENFRTLSQLRDSLEKGETEVLSDFLSQQLLPALSYFDFSCEKTYQVLSLTLMALLYEEAFVKSEVPSGSGRMDILVQPKSIDSPAFILEIKCLKGRVSDSRLSKAAEDALMQITEKDYAENLRKQGFRKIIAYAFVFTTGKKVKIQTQAIE